MIHLNRSVVLLPMWAVELYFASGQKRSVKGVSNSLKNRKTADCRRTLRPG